MNRLTDREKLKQEIYLAGLSLEKLNEERRRLQIKLYKLKARLVEIDQLELSIEGEEW
jgi:hypothetical protein